jgi:Tfp pilus assembly protein PilF
VPGLTVIARTSSFALANQQLDIQKIANRLGVTHVLEGSVRKSGDRVRITAQLIDGASGAHLWSHTYDDQINEVFALQSGIAHAITDVLSSHMLSPIDSGDKRMDFAPGSKNLEAWNLYLRGQYFYGRRADGDLVRAQREYEQALQLDPDFAAAWMGRANTLFIRFAQVDLSENEKLAKSEAMPLVMQAIEKSLQLDPRNAEARARMAQFYWRAGNVEASLEQAYLAMRFGGNNALVQAVLAGLALRFTGPDTAVELQRRAVRLDPVSYVQIENLAYYLYWAGRFDEAEAALERVSEFRQNQGIEIVSLAEWIALLQGNVERATAWLEELPQGSARDQAESMVNSLKGKGPESDEALSRLMQKEDFVSQAAVAYVFGFRGDIDAAFLALNRVTGNLLSEPDLPESREMLFDLKLSPFLHSLHSDSRWREWLAKTEEWQRTPIQAEMAEALKIYAATGTVGERLPR